MKEKKRKAVRLADFDRHSRTRIVCEVFDALLAVDRFFGDHMGEENLRALAERFNVPFMALHLVADGRVTPDDMREWCAFEHAGKAVA